MKSTQKKPNNTEKKNEWQMPARSQVYLTPGAQKSLEDARQKGEQLKIKTDRERRNAEPKRMAEAPPQPQAKNGVPPQKRTEKPVQKKEPLTLKDAVIAEIRDRLRSIRLGIQVNAEDIIRGAVCGVIMMLFALLQTTFFSRFAPFGRVPDLMITFVIAVGVYEGEKWGAVTGIISAFVIQALGSSGAGPELLPLVYMPVGCFAGLLSKYYLRHTLPVNAVYIAVGGIARGIVTVITALFVLDASFGDIVTKIAIPEYFSTLVVSPLPFLTVWIAFKQFHKTRAERTDSRGD